MQKNVKIAQVKTLKVNIGGMGAIKYSEHYCEAEAQLKKKECYSPVPYFLLCKSIELSLKAYLMHLGFKTKDLRSKKYGHNLINLLEEVLEQKNTIVSIDQSMKKNIENANDFYDTYPNGTKSFEYFNIGHAMCGYKKLAKPRSTYIPDLDLLRKTAKILVIKIRNHIAQQPISIV